MHIHYNATNVYFYSALFQLINTYRYFLLLLQDVLGLGKSNMVDGFELLPTLGEVDADAIFQHLWLHLNKCQILKIQATIQREKKRQTKRKKKE